jgi:hypothetical protein
MASSRKLEVQKRRAKERKDERIKRMAHKHDQSRKEQERKKFRAQIREALGFDKLKIKGAYATLDDL